MLPEGPIAPFLLALSYQEGRPGAVYTTTSKDALDV